MATRTRTATYGTRSFMGPGPALKGGLGGGAPLEGARPQGGPSPGAQPGASTRDLTPRADRRLERRAAEVEGERHRDRREEWVGEAGQRGGEVAGQPAEQRRGRGPRPARRRE